ncbi:undecaprenyl/decaprenyl-phosphate alpha-N-acetylglucosaminyl 1-phosphate transferase [Pseudomonadales bacterium]|nr:undecaprenyl/decaprenyl-phosphate alpha-N-acetylglucosaminyl 1-phosphate transferase [Pseudomonadales bacterium]
MEIAISFALALFLSTVFVPVAMRYASVLGLVDEPDGERKIHSNPIPRCGGIAIIIAVFVPTLFWLGDVASLSGFFIGAAIIALFGFLDDRHDLNYKWKFAGQIIGVSVFLLGNVEITKTPFLGIGDLTPWLSYPLMALFVLGVTNAVNLSDGLDGLAAGSSLLSLGFIGYLSYVAGELSLTLVAAATMGGLLGFLRFNTHPASVFMGDAGSQFLGFVAACLAILATQSASSAVSPLIAVMVVGLPILDTLAVMLLRLRDGQSPFHPDKRHIHHQFLTLGLLHYQSVAALYVLNFLLLTIAFFMRFESDLLVLFSYLLFCMSTLGVIAFLKHSAFARRRRAIRAEVTERRNLWLRRVGWIYSHGALAIQYLLGVIWLALVFSTEKIDLSMSGISFAIVIITILTWKASIQSRFYGRFLLYSTSVFSIFIATYQHDLSQLSWGEGKVFIDGLLLVLVVFLALSIRMTRRELFRLDTQDVLVLLLLLASSVLVVGFDSGNQVLSAIIRLAVLLYAAEYIVGREKNFSIAKIFTIATFVVIGLMGIF